jgi:Pvc16 N-terminal domain
MLFEISKTLRTYLLNRFPDPTDWVTISTREIKETDAFPPGQLALLLYGVNENAFMRNRPLQSAQNGYVPPPLALTLSYVITYGGTAEQVQRRLSDVLQAFYSKQRLGPADLDSALIGKVEYLTVRLRALSPEEMTRVWTAFGFGMRLALFYEVDAALIEPLDAPVTPPVAERRENAGSFA